MAGKNLYPLGIVCGVKRSPLASGGSFYHKQLQTVF
jgi:hypothetical protein